MPTPTESGSGRRLALVIATGTYADPALAKLRAPGRDATDLADVLGDEEIGGFEVETVLDARAEVLRRQVAEFCAGIGPHDLTLVYLSCHGVLDDRGRLYYATADTDRELLSATAVPATWLNEQLEDCRSRRQILVLDCCHSGAFAKGAKGEGELALRDRFEGRGRVVLTGSRGTEYSFEHGDVVGDGVSSVFTGALVEGLRSGEADRDGDGLVGIGELYDYAYETVRAKEARQTPTLWSYGAEGDLPVAQSPRGQIIEPVPLPEELLALLESSRPRLRETAVAELAVLLEGSDPGRALSAREALERVAAEDVPRVAKAAQTALGPAPMPAPTGTDKAGPPDPPIGTAEPARPAPPPPPPPPPGPGGWWAEAGNRRLALIGGAVGALLVAVAIVAVLAGGGESGPETFNVGGSPRGVAVGGGAWIARHEGNGVTRIDSDSNEEQIEVGPRPGRVATGEHSVWVSYAANRKLARIDPAKLEVTETIPFWNGCECTVSELAIGSGKLWVSSGDGGTITSFNPRSGEEIEGSGPIPGFEGQFALNPNAIWAVGSEGSETAKKEGKATALLTRLDIFSGEQKVEFSEKDSYFGGVAYGDGLVWLADTNRDVVTAFDPGDGKTTDIPIENGLYVGDIAFADGSVLVWDPDLGILTQIDPGKMQIVGEQTVAGFAQHDEADIAHSDLAAGAEFAWVTDPAKGMAHKLGY